MLSSVWKSNLELLLWKDKSEGHKQADNQDFGGYYRRCIKIALVKTLLFSLGKNFCAIADQY
ncbi:hypothetical protein [Nostoc sp.]|uniref:hypothetical protein n=1 Tax=Nostoc sp. TaxID=1180 RepID=UPI002FEE841F